MNLIIKERRLRWLGHVLRMEEDRIPRQAMYWQLDHHVKRKPGRPRKNWIGTISSVVNKDFGTRTRTRTRT